MPESIKTHSDVSRIDSDDVTEPAARPAPEPAAQPVAEPTASPVANGHAAMNGHAPHPPSPRRQKPASKINSETQDKLVFVLWVIKRWYPVCVPAAVLLAGLAAFIVWYTYAPTYQATAFLKIESRQQNIVFKDPTEDSRSFVETQIQTMRSPLVLGEVLNVREIADLPLVKAQYDPMDWLKAHLTVSAMGRSELFNVRFTAPTPAIAAKAANAVVDSFMALHADDGAQQAQRVIELLEQERELKSKDVERRQESVRELTKRVTGKDPSIAGAGETIILSTNEDEQRLAELEVERQVMEARLKALQEAIAANPDNVEVPDDEIEQALSADTDLAELRGELEALKTKLKEVASVAKLGDDDPAATPWKEQVVKKQGELEEEANLRRAWIREQLAKAYVSDRQQQLAELHEQIADKQVLEELFRKRIDERIASQENVGGLALELQFAKTQLEREQDVLNRINDRLLAMKTELRAPMRVSKLKEADEPRLPIDGGPMKLYMLSLLASIAAPFALAIGWESLVKRIVEVEQVAETTNVPVLGEIAALPARRNKTGANETPKFLRQQELYEESIDALRTNLVLSPEMEGVQVLSVASAVSSEGKTSLSSQLAVSLARASGEPTLLIDGDMRAPDLHDIFNISNKVGLADVLDGKAEASDAIVTDWHEHLHLMPAGRLKQSPYQLLSNGAIESLLAELRDRYKYIVIDAPPVLSASEALILAKAADGTILCTMKDRTRSKQLKLAQERLDAAGVRSLGSVLAGVPSRSYAYKYGGYYYYGKTHHEDGDEQED